jgi:glycerol-3-phosphate dehydrogenase
MIFQNLVKHNLIKQGTWIGITNHGNSVIHRISVESITSSGDLIGIDYTNNQKVRVTSQAVVEIDGMNISRFLEQADLDKNGEKIVNLVRRGRKPKNRL